MVRSGFLYAASAETPVLDIANIIMNILAQPDALFGRNQYSIKLSAFSSHYAIYFFFDEDLQLRRMDCRYSEIFGNKT